MLSVTGMAIMIIIMITIDPSENKEDHSDEKDQEHYFLTGIYSFHFTFRISLHFRKTDILIPTAKKIHIIMLFEFLL